MTVTTFKRDPEKEATIRALREHAADFGRRAEESRFRFLVGEVSETALKAHNMAFNAALGEYHQAIDRYVGGGEL